MPAAALWREFLRDLGRPEYVHVLLNPLPTYVLAAGLVGLIVSLAARSRAAQVISLAGIVLASASAWIVVHFGHAAYDRVYSMSPAAAQPWLDWHAKLADRLVWVDTAAAVLGLLTLAAFAAFPKLVRLGLGLTLALCIAAVAFGAFVGFVGGKVRHPEFRTGPPPVKVPPYESG